MARLFLAEVSDLAAWLGKEIPDSDPRARAVLSHASNRVRAYAGQRWDEGEIPYVVSDVVVRVAARAWRNPDDLESVTIDDGTKRWGSIRGLVLTDEDREDLNPFRVDSNGPAGIGTVGTYRGDVPLNDTLYVPTEPPPSGHPFPWYSADDV